MAAPRLRPAVTLRLRLLRCAAARSPAGIGSAEGCGARPGARRHFLPSRPVGPTPTFQRAEAGEPHPQAAARELAKRRAFSSAGLIGGFGVPGGFAASLVVPGAATESPVSDGSGADSGDSVPRPEAAGSEQQGGAAAGGGPPHRDGDDEDWSLVRAPQTSPPMLPSRRRSGGGGGAGDGAGNDDDAGGGVGGGTMLSPPPRRGTTDE